MSIPHATIVRPDVVTVGDGARFAGLSERSGVPWRPAGDGAADSGWPLFVGSGCGLPARHGVAPRLFQRVLFVLLDPAGNGAKVDGGNRLLITLPIDDSVYGNITVTPVE